MTWRTIDFSALCQETDQKFGIRERDLFRTTVRRKLYIPSAQPPQHNDFLEPCDDPLMLWELTAQTPTKTRGLDKTSRLMGNFVCVLHSMAADSSRLRHETDPPFLALKSSFCCLAEFGERIFLPFTNNKVFP